MTKTFIASGSSNKDFAKKLSVKTRIPLAKVLTGRFSNGEAQVRIEEYIYGNIFYVIQSLSEPVDEHIMELCLMVDALKRGGAKRIVAIIPWFGYGVQDKVFMPGEALSSKVVIDFLQTVGVQSLITVDLHSDNIIGFFEVPVVHISAIPLFTKFIRKNYGTSVLVVSPDFGGAKRARRFAKELGQTSGVIGIIDKERSLTDGSVTLRGINLDVKNKIIVIPDDFISTGGTLVQVVQLLKKSGAKKIIACITHPLLSKDAAQNLSKSPIDLLVVTDSVVIDSNKMKVIHKKLKVLSICDLLTGYVL
jgi:ribose-phosphate pyrophosphokinase